MENLHTFTTFEKFQFTVKPEFLKVCKEPEKVDRKTLITEHNIIKYLHNPEGPAVVRLDGRTDVDQELFVINGKIIKDEKEIAKIKHESEFKNKLDKIVND